MEAVALEAREAMQAQIQDRLGLSQKDCIPRHTLRSGSSIQLHERLDVGGGHARASTALSR